MWDEIEVKLRFERGATDGVEGIEAPRKPVSSGADFAVCLSFSYFYSLLHIW